MTDTAAKRASALSAFKPFLFLVPPDGEIATGDRMTLAGVYGSGSASLFPNSAFTSAPKGRVLKHPISRQVIKDPDEVVDWWLCLADPASDNRLGTDTIDEIVSVAVDAADELLVLQSGINSAPIIDDIGETQPTGTVIALWLGSGVAGSTYELTVTYTTAGGRTYDDVLLIRCLND